jgi:hypothetical protein
LRKAARKVLSSQTPGSRSWYDQTVRYELNRSLLNPHAESTDFADEGFEACMRSLAEEDAGALVKDSAGKPVRWIAVEGWVEGARMKLGRGAGMLNDWS